MPAFDFWYTIDLLRDKKRNCPAKLELFWELILLRADVSKYRPEVYKSEKSKILKKNSQSSTR